MIRAALPDGTPVLVRPVRPEDKPLLVAGMERLSERSRRLRFLTATDHLSRQQLTYLTEVDGRDHQAWGVLVEEEAVAIGRFVRLEDDVAEVALTVVDDWQQRGIGRLLLGVLAKEARQVGVKTFTFVALPENAAIAAMLSGFGIVGEIDEGLLVADVDLDLIPTPELTAEQHARNIPEPN